MTADNTPGRGKTETIILSRYDFMEKHNRGFGCEVDSVLAAVNSSEIDPTSGDPTPDFNYHRLVCRTHKEYSAPFVPTP